MQQSYGHFEEDHLGRISDLRIWRRLMSFFVPHWRHLLWAILLSLVVTASSLALPHLIQIGMDEYILDMHGVTADRVRGLLELAGWFGAVVLLGFAANFWQVLALEWAGQKTMQAMRQELFEHLQSLDLYFFDVHPVGKLTTRLTNDVQNMHELFTSVIVTLFNDAIKLLGILAILYWMNWRLSLLLFTLLPVILATTLLFGRYARDAFRAIRTNLARINAFLQESISGMAILQLFMREQDIRADFALQNDRYYRSTLYQIHIFGVFVPLIEVMNSLAMVLIIWYGGVEILDGHMTLGVLTAFLTYMRLFFQPIRELSQKYSIVQSAMASAERIFQLLETQERLPIVAEPLAPMEVKGDIEFRRVGFAYEPGQPVLREISFRVRPGETLAIVGATGSGKTTIINLLERFYDPTEGEVLLDGTDLRELDPFWLRRQIGLVMQDVLLIPDTMKANIMLDRTMDQEELERLVELSQLSALVEDLPEGLDTRIGEGALDLSAGQRQLLAFARVLARNPRILILDEATANVDSATEWLVEQAIQATLTNRTNIVIAHRLSTIRRADRILVVERGHLIEEGTHETLMARRGLFFHLQSLQTSLVRTGFEG